MNIAVLLKAYDAVMAVRDVARRVQGPRAPEPAEPSTPPATVTTPIEARLTNVVVAALKEAFDRDHARLELERAQLEEERRRAEAALRLELRRRATDCELGRLRWLAGAALVGWIASVALVVFQIGAMSGLARGVAAFGWLLLLAALAAAFSGQARIGRADIERAAGSDGSDAERAGAAALWLLVAGLAVAAGSILL